MTNVSFLCSTTHADKRRRKIANSEKIKIIQNESPELIDLLDEFKERSKIVEKLQNIVEK
jgi:U3 small nucleolar RNA-associated protein 3